MDALYDSLDSFLLTLYLDGPSNQLEGPNEEIHFPGHTYYYFLSTYNPLTFLNQNLSDKDYKDKMQGYFDHDNDDFPFEFILMDTSSFYLDKEPVSLESVQSYQQIMPAFAEEYQFQHKKNSQQAQYNNAMLYFARKQDRFKRGIKSVWAYTDESLDTFIDLFIESQLHLLQNNEFPEAMHLFRELKKESEMELASKYLMYSIIKTHKGSSSLTTVKDMCKNLFIYEQEGEQEIAKLCAKELARQVGLFQYQ